MVWRNTGFSLIELMIVVTILGVLSVISTPLYERYIAKIQVSRAVSELSS